MLKNNTTKWAHISGRAWGFQRCSEQDAYSDEKGGNMNMTGVFVDKERLVEFFTLLEIYKSGSMVLIRGWVKWNWNINMDRGKHNIVS